MGRKTIVLAAIFVSSLYFLAMHWLKAADPVVISPPIRGEIIRLYPPFAPHGRGVMTPDYWFASIADSESDRCRSSVIIYENDNPLGPLHSPSSLIARFGRGRAAHWRSTDDPLLYDRRSAFVFSSTDNTNPSSNGRAYWAVRPNLNAITCPDIEPQRDPPPPREPPPPPELAQRPK